MRFPLHLRTWAKELKRQTLTVYYIARHPKTPGYVKGLALIVAAYALSPIDLIPDFIPILGLLDDLVLVPLGVALVVRLTPTQVIAAAQEDAQRASEKPTSYLGAACIVALWAFLLYLMVRNLL